ncbi:dihydroorotate dehydrogenase (NAD+) catalytic subunit [Virgibacillus halotolerans]|uniref:dihydroorotate dehydrogenase n=1 Tax=Virgibacillus halotolerans TaxID=1071053 RepID=UPI0019600FDF|nr:dihydroorotate dehydrogenase [Virgibacillus halotolerans]MBM7599091.1 dihydroorotate dehydrogenase (NAD+) catalytic subunit [Virgibacillus halotolerans]
MESLKLDVKIGELKLKNPIMPASGAFGFEMESLFDFNQLGAIVPKSITKYPRGGNATPRVCEVTGGMLNSIGIQSKGLPYYLKNILPQYEQYNTPLIASISADSVDEFAEMSEIISKEKCVSGIELNISCPNLEGDGKAFGMDAELSYQLIKKVKAVTNQSIIAKLTPNVTSIQEIALACENGGADGLNVANTMLAMAIDIHTRKPKIGNVLGGISGPAIKPIIVRLIHQVRKVTEIPIIGCGGVMNWEDAIEMILAGANAIQVGTANFINPLSMMEILEGIKRYMTTYQIEDINDLVGKTDIPV